MIEVNNNNPRMDDDILRSIYTDSPICIEIFDSKGKLIDINQSCMDLFGISNKDEVRGFDLFNDPNIPEVQLTKLKRRETIRYESSFDFDLVKEHNLYETKKIGMIYIDVLITPLFAGQKNSLTNYLVQIQDITDSKIAEHKLIDLKEDLEDRVQERTKQLRKSEESWRFLVEEAPDIIFTVDRNRRILYINKVRQGMPREQAIGVDVLNYVNPEYHEIVRNTIEKVFQTGESDYYEIETRGPDDIISWYSTRIGTIKQGDLVVSVILITRDITERKKMEQKLKKSKERYHTLVDSISDIIFEINLDGKITYLSPQTIDILGYNPEELINRNAFRFIHPDDQEEVLNSHKYVIDSGKIETVEFRIFHKDGHSVHVSSRGQLIEKDGKKQIIGLFRDITERKNIEKSVYQEREKSETYLNLVNVIIVALGRDGNILIINKKGNEILGWNEGELKGKNWFKNCILPQDRETVANYFNKLMDGELDIVPFYENSIITKNGDVKLIAWSTILFKDSNGNITGALSSGEDITEKKKAEKDLIDKQATIESIFKAAPTGIGLINNRVFNQVNDQFCKLVGYTRDELLNQNSRMLYPTDENYEYVGQEQYKQIQEQEIGIVETQFKRKDGKIIDVLLNSTLINRLDPSLGHSFTALDITERKKAEERLLESEKKLLDLIESVPVGISISTPEGKMLECNSHSIKLLGYSSKEEFLRIPVADFYHDPSDRIRFLELIEGGLVKNFEVKFQRRDGSIFWASLTSVVHQMGDQTKIINSLQDITDRKIAEIKIQQSEAELSAIYNYTPIAMLLLDKERRIRKINKFALKFTDRSEDEVFGVLGGEALRCLYSINDPRGCGFSEQCEKCVIRNTVLDTLHSKNPHINIEATLNLLPGSKVDKIHLLFSTVPLNVEGEDRVLVSMIDITERIRAEQKLKESEEKYRMISNQYKMLLESITDAVYAINRDWEYILVNKNAENVVTMPIENLLGHKIFEVFPGIENTPFFKTYEAVMNNRNADRVVEPFTHPDGRAGYYEVSVYPIKEGILCIGKDVTEEKEIEHKLKDSEERYRELFENSPVALFEHDYTGLKMYIDNLKASGITNFEQYFDENPVEIVKCISKAKLTDINKKALDLYKIDNKEEIFKMKEQLEKDLYRNAAPDVVSINKQEILSLIEGNTTFEAEAVTKNFMGELVYIFTKSMLIPGYERDWSKVIVSLLDITTRKKTEQKLKESEEKFRTIAEQSSIGVAIQQGGFIRFANTAVSEIIEYPMEEILNQPVENIYKMVYEEDLSIVIEKFKGRQTGDYESKSQFDLRLLSKSGKIKWISIFTKPIKYLGENAVLSTLIDITAKKQVEEELKEVSRLKSDLLSRTSHELKTPLVSIKGYADLLLSQHYDALDFYTISILHEIKQGCSRLESLIKDLLETSKLESGEIELNKSEEDLAFLIRFCIRDLQGLLEIRNHKLLLELQEDMKTVFEKERIYDVIINLLSNAIKYTPSGGTIKINSDTKNGYYIISINDDGIGLTKEEKSKIFQKFGKIERYGKGLDVISEGSGLGLYISKSIIHLHGGDIWVESKGRDKGSSFSFSLPILKS